VELRDNTQAKRSDRGRERRVMRRMVSRTDAYSFFDWLTDDATLDRVESLLPTHRERMGSRFIFTTAEN